MQSGWPPKEFVLPAKEAVSAAQLHLLVVQDNETLQLRELLESLGFTIQVFHNGGEVLESIAKMNEIAGILLDVHARTTDGGPLLSQLRDRYPQIPVITISDVKDIGLLRKSVERGAREYLVRPIDQEVLRLKCAYVFIHGGRVGPPKAATR